MTETQPLIKEKINSLKNDIQTLEQTLRLAVDHLQKDGQLPDEEVIYEITQCSQAFKDLVEEAVELSDSTFKISSSLIHTVADLDNIIEAYIEHHDNNQEEFEKALNLTKQMMFIKHTVEQEFNEIDKVIENANQVFQDLVKDQDNELITSLNSYQHVLARLYNIIKNIDHLSDHELDKYQKSIAQEYGSAIYAASLRGRLAFDSIPDNIDAVHESDDNTKSSGDKTRKSLKENYLLSADDHQSHTALSVQNNSNLLDETFIGSKSAVLALSEEKKPLKIKMPINKAQNKQKDQKKLNKTELELPKEDVKDSLPSPHISKDEKEKKSSVKKEKSSNEILEQSEKTKRELSKGNMEEGPSLHHTSTDEKEIYLETQEKEKKSFAIKEKPLNQIVHGEIILENEILKETKTEDLFELVLRLLQDKNRRSLAYQITKIQNEMSDSFSIPIQLIRSVILGLSTFSPRHQEYLTYFTKDFEELEYVESLQDNNTLDLNLLLAAATIQPAVFSPSTNASQVLQNVRISQLNNFYDYCQEIAKFGSLHIALDISAVKGDAGEENEKRNFQSDIKLWWDKVVHMDLTFGLAAKIRNRLISSSGLLYQIYTAILEDNREIDKYIKSQGLDIESIDSYIRKIEKEVNDSNRSGVVTGTPFKKLHTIVDDAIKFAEQWHDMVERKQKKSKALKTYLAPYEEKAIKELNWLAENDKKLSIQAGAHLCLEAIRNLQKVFSPNDMMSTIEYRMPMHYLLNVDLLRLEGTLLNDQWDVEGEDNTKLLDDIINFIRKDSWNWREIFESRCSACELEATERIIKYISDKGEDVSYLDSKQSQMTVECQDKLYQQLLPTRKIIENAVALGMLDESLRLEQQAIVDEIEQQFNDDRILRFAAKLQSLKSIENKIVHKGNEKKRILLKRLESMKSINETDKKRIEEIIEDNDVLTANEYLDMIERGEALPTDTEEENPYAFSMFFPDTFRKLEDVLNINPFAKICKMVKNKKSIKGLSWQYITAKHLERAAEMLENWLSLKRSENVNLNNLKMLFEYFGFNVKEINQVKQEKSTITNYSWIDLKTDIIADQKTCNVPQYGSSAKGNYRVLCTWSNPTDDELLNEIGETKQLRTPTIVLFFTKLSENRRRKIAKICRERLRTYISIDDIVTLFLTSATGSRLPLLFTATLPFTYLEPYSSTAGLVPPEMFYGRKRERQSIIDPMGSCFIYGGRQLGKTALLRDIERTYHDRKKGHLVIWLDLKVLGLGTDTSLDDIWYYLGQSLAKEGVLSAVPKRTITFDKIQEEIIVWLDQNNDRSMLFLLDESDDFLEGDGVLQDASERKSNLTGFTRSTKLKGLMDATDRRFKVVFAGLHNVQRTTKLANHPLAHFGENICIGPLLEHGESRSARALIKEPLEAIGFKISDDLVTRILSQTNYYPSLIQLYCQELITHIYKYYLSKFNDKVVPPYEILSKHVEEAYQSTSLRKSIKDRFLWTLQLDQRYEVIAYAIARETFIGDDDTSYQHGFSLKWIEKEAKSWWSEGFKNNLGNNILVLLDEMVDLGILRKTDQNRFALRSPNVGLLLGTEEEMDAVLVREREIPHEYEPSISRSILFKNKKPDYSRRNPLTALQESTFRTYQNDVSIIIGSQLGLLSTATEFLKSTFIDQLEILPASSDIHEFKSQVDKLTANRLKENLPMIIAVDQNSAWTISWVNESIQKLKRLRHKKSFVHIVFISDPKNFFILMQDQPNLISELESQSVNLISLAPWHDQTVRQWLEETSYVNYDQNNRNTIFKVTGNWQALLEDFYQLTKRDRGGWKDKLRLLEKEMLSRSKLEEYLQATGIKELPFNLLQNLKNLAEFGSMTCEELYELDELKTPQYEIDLLLEWALKLNYIRSEGNDVWKIDHFIQKLLKSDA